MPEISRKTYAERLARFASELRNHVHDEAMLREIHAAMKELLTANDASEQKIRQVLQQQYEAGALRKESYQLVGQLIERIRLEEPDNLSRSANDDVNPLKATAVIPREDLDRVTGDRRLQVGTVLRDRYMLQREVEGGSMGSVFKALDRRLAETNADNHWVAIKVLAPKLSHNVIALRALQQEAAKTRCLTHRNIVRFIDLDREDDLYFMVMEWLDGRSLSEILHDSKQRNIDIDMAVQIIKQVAAALDHAHQRGIVHADVKPGNIIITPDGQVKLFDFGVARVLQQEGSEDDSFKASDLKAATPAYSSMQVLTGEDPTPADDVFSLACLAYRLIAGYRVFGPRNAAEAADAGMKPQRIDSLSDQQWRALKKALSFSRVPRFASPADFMDAFTGRTPVAETEDTSPTVELQALPDRSNSRLVLWFILLVVAATLGWQLGVVEQVQQLISSQPGIVAPVDSMPTAEESVLEPEAAGSSSGAAVVIEQEPTATDDPEDSPIPATDIATEPEESPLPDFSLLPKATVEIQLGAEEGGDIAIPLVMLEDSAPVSIDVVRQAGLDSTRTLFFSELRHSGSMSPMEAGQYTISNDARLNFAVGQERARSTISMISDPRREADADVQLRLADIDNVSRSLATVNLTLQDDDLRAFEYSLAPNTIAFAVSQVSVQEGDAAVQIDVIRHKADSTPMTVRYKISNVTATEGEDYFDPGSSSVSFAANQRSAQIVIPLVQDTAPENDEAFLLELEGSAPQTNSNIYRRIAVMIRDDDS